MGDEVTIGEVSRSIAELKLMVVNRDMYAADQRTDGYRFAEIDAKIDDLRRVHAEDIRELHTRITEQAKTGAEHRMHWRTLLWTGALPAVVAAASAVISFMISHGGGH